MAFLREKVRELSRINSWSELPDDHAIIEDHRVISNALRRLEEFKPTELTFAQKVDMYVDTHLQYATLVGDNPEVLAVAKRNLEKCQKVLLACYDRDLTALHALTEDYRIIQDIIEFFKKCTSL